MSEMEVKYHQPADDSRPPWEAATCPPRVRPELWAPVGSRMGDIDAAVWGRERAEMLWKEIEMNSTGVTGSQWKAYRKETITGLLCRTGEGKDISGPFLRGTMEVMLIIGQYLLWHWHAHEAHHQEKLIRCISFPEVCFWGQFNHL